MTSVIELEQLSVTFGKRQILRSLDGGLNGRSIGLLGPKSNAHGPNEFLHIPTGKKLTAAMAKVIADHYVNRGTPNA